MITIMVLVLFCFFFGVKANIAYTVWVLAVISMNINKYQ